MKGILSEKQWLEMSYATHKQAIDNLDHQHTTDVAVYRARRELVVQEFDAIADRLNEIEKEEESKC